MVKDMHPQAIKEATASVLPVWLDAFKVLGNLDPSQDVSGTNWDGLAIRIQVYKVNDLTSLIQSILFVTSNMADKHHHCSDP
jgi:hypothetical protein